MDFIRINLPETLIEWLPPVAMVASVIALGVILGIVMRRKEQKLHEAQRELTATFAKAQAHRREVEEAHAKSTALLGAIQRLSLRLEERMIRFEQEFGGRVATTAGAAPAGGPGPANRTAHAAPQPPAARLRHVGAADSPAKNGAAHTAMPTLATFSGRTGSAAATMEAKPPLDPVTRSIYDLADAGRKPLDIARQLGEHVGKVELILALRAHAAPA